MDSDGNEKESFKFTESTFDSDEQLTHIMHGEKDNSQLFNLAEGLVFRCHLVHHKQTSTDDLLTEKDAIIFNFHHASFDLSSMSVFLHDLDHAYATSELIFNDATTLRYLDCE